MQFTFNNNPIDKLSCWLHNKREDISGVLWKKGKQKTAECRICGKILDSHKDKYSPMQCGWHRVSKYSWICHKCFDHRNFRPFIEMIDEADRKWWEEHHEIERHIWQKAQEVINLLKEYVPEYQEFLDLYYLWDIECDYEDGHREKDFTINITDKNETYELRITNHGVTKVSLKDNKEINNISYKENTSGEWTWDDAIEVIKKRLEEN